MLKINSKETRVNASYEGEVLKTNNFSATLSSEGKVTELNTAQVNLKESDENIGNISMSVDYSGRKSRTINIDPAKDSYSAQAYALIDEIVEAIETEIAGNGVEIEVA